MTGGGKRTGIACATCEEGWYRSICEPCGGGASVLLSFVLALLPVGLWGGCVSTAKPYAAKTTAAFAMVSTFGIMLTFMQMLGMMSGFSMEWPLEFGALFSIGNLLLLDLEGLGVGCIVGN